MQQASFTDKMTRFGRRTGINVEVNFYILHGLMRNLGQRQDNLDIDNTFRSLRVERSCSHRLKRESLKHFRRFIAQSCQIKKKIKVYIYMIQSRQVTFVSNAERRENTLNWENQAVSVMLYHSVSRQQFFANVSCSF